MPVLKTGWSSMMLLSNLPTRTMAAAPISMKISMTVVISSWLPSAKTGRRAEMAPRVTMSSMATRKMPTEMRAGWVMGFSLDLSSL